MPVGKKSIARMASVTLNQPEEAVAGIAVSAPEVPKGTPATPVKKAPAKKPTQKKTPTKTAPAKQTAAPVLQNEAYAVGSVLPYWLL